MTARILPAARRHARPMAAILRGWADEVPWMPAPDSAPETRRLMRRLIARRSVYVLRRRWRVLGFIALDRAGHVEALYLAPQARGQGLGRALLDHAKRLRPALSLRAHRANLPARQFYRREGFAEVEWGDGHANDEGLPDVRLEWRAAA